MNHRDMAHVKMQTTVFGVLDTNKTIWQANTAMTTVKNSLKAGLDLITELQKKQPDTTTGVTQDKAVLRRAVADAAIIVAGAVGAYADGKGDHDLFEDVNFTASDLKFGPEQNCKTNCANILKKGTDNLAALTAAGTLAQTDLDTLSQALAAFSASITKPREAKAATKEATDQLPAAVLANDRTLERQADGLMEKYRVSYPDFYRAYQVARIIVDIGAHLSEAEKEKKAAKKAAVTTPAA